MPHLQPGDDTSFQEHLWGGDGHRTAHGSLWRLFLCPVHIIICFPARGCVFILSCSTGRQRDGPLPSGTSACFCHWVSYRAKVWTLHRTLLCRAVDQKVVKWRKKFSIFLMIFSAYWHFWEVQAVLLLSCGPEGQSTTIYSYFMGKQ